MWLRQNQKHQSCKDWIWSLFRGESIDCQEPLVTKPSLAERRSNVDVKSSSSSSDLSETDLSSIDSQVLTKTSKTAIVNSLMSDQCRTQRQQLRQKREQEFNDSPSLSAKLNHLKQKQDLTASKGRQQKRCKKLKKSRLRSSERERAAPSRAFPVLYPNENKAHKLLKYSVQLQDPPLQRCQPSPCVSSNCVAIGSDTNNHSLEYNEYNSFVMLENSQVAQLCDVLKELKDLFKNQKPVSSPTKNKIPKPIIPHSSVESFNQIYDKKTFAQSYDKKPSSQNYDKKSYSQKYDKNPKQSQSGSCNYCGAPQYAQRKNLTKKLQIKKSESSEKVGVFDNMQRNFLKALREALGKMEKEQLCDEDKDHGSSSSVPQTQVISQEVNPQAYALNQQPNIDLPNQLPQRYQPSDNQLRRNYPAPQPVSCPPFNQSQSPNSYRNQNQNIFRQFPSANNQHCSNMAPQQQFQGPENMPQQMWQNPNRNNQGYRQSNQNFFRPNNYFQDQNQNCCQQQVSRRQMR